MKPLLLLVLATLSQTLLSAPAPKAEYDWQKRAQEGISLPGTVMNTEGRVWLRIQNTNSVGKTVCLLTLTNLPPLRARYELLGEIRYERVTGDGYLELWNHFAASQPGMPEAKYFSRTLSASGPMGKITGSSDWRQFRLPFDRTGTSNSPSQLVLNLVLPASGTVDVGICSLLDGQSASAGTWSSGSGAWWSERTGGLVGGTLGAIFGCYASFISFLAKRGKARNLVIQSWRLLVTFGVLALVIGLAAIGLRQPYAVWYPLVLLGVLLGAIAMARLRQTQRRYEELELRKMAAMDAR